MALVGDGTLSLSTTARSLLGDDLPLIDDRVTIEHLLGHRSGIGDYLDESAVGSINDYVMTEPGPHPRLPCAALVLLADRAMSDPPGVRFAYNNGGFVLLALLAERAAGTDLYDLVDQLVCQPAGLGATGFLRTDELDGNTAIGYLDRTGLRCNVLHVPVRGIGDGGLYTTTADMARFWQALFAGEILQPTTTSRSMTTAQGHTAGGVPYGLGLWLDPHTDAAGLEGYDAGISFKSVHRPSADAPGPSSATGPTAPGRSRSGCPTRSAMRPIGDRCRVLAGNVNCGDPVVISAVVRPRPRCSGPPRELEPHRWRLAARPMRRHRRASVRPPFVGSSRGGPVWRSPARRSSASSTPPGRTAPRRSHPARHRRSGPAARVQPAATVLPATGPGFAELGVPERWSRVLAEHGAHHPFPIQQATLADALAGRDLLGRGRTGSGKTIAFALPLVIRLAAGRRTRPSTPRPDPGADP